MIAKAPPQRGVFRYKRDGPTKKPGTMAGLNREYEQI